MHHRERYVFQYPEMRIFADDVVCHGNYGTIYKLVIILVLFDKAKMIIGILAQYIRRMKHYLYETMCHQCRCFLRQYFLIFIQYLIGQAEDKALFDESSPQSMIFTMLAQHL